MILALALLLQVNYAAEALKERVDELSQERLRLVTAQRELKTDYTETLRFLDDAIADIERAKLKLNGRDDAEAIKALDARGVEFSRQRAALLEHRDAVNPRDLLAEIAEIDRQINALNSSLVKVQR